MRRTYTLLISISAIGLLLPAATAAADPAAADPGQQLAALNQQLNDAQATLNDLNNSVERAQADLDALDRRVAEDQQRHVELKRRLSRVARIEYERPALSLATILSTSSLAQLLAEVAQARLVALKQQALVSEADSLRRQDEQARDLEASKLTEITRAREQASKIAAQTLAMRDSVQDAAVRAHASAVAAQAQASAAQATAPLPPQAQAAGPPTPATQPTVPQSPATQPPPPAAPATQPAV